MTEEINLLSYVATALTKQHMPAPLPRTAYTAIELLEKIGLKASEASATEKLIYQMVPDNLQTRIIAGARLQEVYNAMIVQGSGMVNFESYKHRFTRLPEDYTYMRLQLADRDEVDVVIFPR